MWPISATLATRPMQLALQILGFPVSNDSQNATMCIRDIMSTDGIEMGDHAAAPIPQYLHARAMQADVDIWEASMTRDTKSIMLEPINMTTIKDQDTWPPFYSAKSPLNYCGDTIEHQDLDTTGPDVADCAALKGIVDYEPGYWDVTANAGGNGYMLITSHGTCGFVVKPWNTAADLLIGSQDVSDLLYDQITKFPDNQTYSAMSCVPGQAMTSWAIINVEAE